MAVAAVKGQLLTVDSSAVFVCDVQERFRDHISHFAAVLESIRRLVEMTKILNVPLFVTEQYPKGLGSTVAELDIGHAVIKQDKTVFSMLIPELRSKLNQAQNIRNVILCGLETHVCIQQTSLDLLANGYHVFVVADACGSRSLTDRHFALKRLQQAGCIVTTYESVLLQLVGSKDHAQFKDIQNLIKQLPPDCGLLHKL